MVFYDQLGCGNSERPIDKSLWTVERFRDELIELYNHLEFDSVDLLGQSWGTVVAVESILSGKINVRKCILSAPCLSVKTWIEDQRKLLNQMPANFIKTILECEEAKNFESEDYQNAMLEYYKRHLCKINPWPDCVNETFKGFALNIYNYMWGPSEFTTTGTLTNYDCTNRLKDIQIPVLYTCGEFDEATPETVTNYSKSTPNSQVTVLKNASHLHHLESEKESLETIRKFLD